jgi:hypothetical protein
VKISRRTKFLLGAATVLGVLSFLIIVDLGVNAGRIHRGVEVSGIDVGGLTEDEAYGKLYPIGEEMSETPIVFFGNTFECRLVPEELGWGPQVAGTADAAYGVGRAESLFEDGLDRVKAWFGKADVRWTGKPNTRRVGAWINQCEKSGAARGEDVDKANLRFLLKTALRTWPRPQIWDIPTEG